MQYNLPDDWKTITNKICKVRDKVDRQHSFCLSASTISDEL